MTYTNEFYYLTGIFFKTKIVTTLTFAQKRNSNCIDAKLFPHRNNHTFISKFRRKNYLL